MTRGHICFWIPKTEVSLRQKIFEEIIAKNLQSLAGERHTLINLSTLLSTKRKSSNKSKVHLYIVLKLLKTKDSGKN